jgi:hypothetical protein
MARWIGACLPALLALAALVGVLTASPAHAESMAFVRVLHAAPDPAAAKVDVFVDDQAVLTNFTFGTLTDYLPLAPGAHSVKVAPAGAGAAQAVISANVSLTANTYYTIAAVSQAKGGFDAKVFTDDVSNPPSGQARVTVVHLSPDAGPVDVAVTGGQVLISNLTFGNASSALEVPAGSYNLEVRKAGTTTVALSLPNTQLQAGMIYTVYAIGLASGSPQLQVKVGATGPTPGMPNTAGGPVVQQPVSNGPTGAELALIVSSAMLVLAGLGLAGSRLAVARAARHPR